MSAQHSLHAQRPAPGSEAFEPLKVVELDVGDPLGALLASHTLSGTPYGRARMLARLHGSPLGFVDLDLGGGTVSPEDITSAVGDRLGTAIAAHLEADGLLGATWPEPPGGCSTRLSPGSPAPFVTVVVCTVHRAEGDLDKCLAALCALDYPSFEVLVVDNSPESPKTREIVAGISAVDSRVRMLREPRRGLSHARNAGLIFARGDIVAFTDDDVLVDAGWLGAIAGEFGADPLVGCVTGLVATAEVETRDQAWFDIHGGFDKGYRRRVFDLAEHRDASRLYPYQLGLLGTGANMAFRRSMLPDNWRFDVALGAGSATQGGEDQDAFLDVLYRGQRIVYSPRALVWHRHRRDHVALRRQMFHFGTGVGAVIAKRAVGHRGHRADLLRRVPAGVGHLLRPGARTRPVATGYPADLRRAELLGLVAGPAIYLGSRLKGAWATA